MPVICTFYGIKIIMYYKDHNPPHFHVRYSGHSAIMDFSGNVINGSLPSRAVAMIRDWTRAHGSELKHNWNNARIGEPLKKIEPLD